MPNQVSIKFVPRRQLEELLRSALTLWDLDQEIGSVEALNVWIKEFLVEELGPEEV